MKFLYFTRTVFISFEFFFIVLALSTYELIVEQRWLESVSISSENEVAKWLILLPFGVLLWNLKEARIVMGLNEKQAQVIAKWKFYWKLKQHVIVSVMYAVLFVIFSISPWIFFNGVKSEFGIYTFFIGLFGQIIVASSIYFAKMNICETLNKYDI